ncbi:hypothetical protein GCM10011490_25740 [Pseudoclavibacter endophyticus]|nr:hypothetical protein GCM10011490_25740 [Pseudoclavibacter endophyticus]
MCERVMASMVDGGHRAAHRRDGRLWKHRHPQHDRRRRCEALRIRCRLPGAVRSRTDFACPHTVRIPGLDRNGHYAGACERMCAGAPGIAAPRRIVNRIRA